MRLCAPVWMNDWYGLCGKVDLPIFIVVRNTDPIFESVAKFHISHLPHCALYGGDGVNLPSFIEQGGGDEGNF